MAQRTPTRQNGTRSTRQARRLNRAEQQAMEIRNASTLTGTSAVAEPRAQPAVQVAQPRMAGAPSTARTRRRRETKQALRSVTLTREQEYGFIRSDLRRLLLLSGILVVVMIVALFVIEAIV